MLKGVYTTNQSVCRPILRRHNKLPGSVMLSENDRARVNDTQTRVGIELRREADCGRKVIMLADFCEELAEFATALDEDGPITAARRNRTQQWFVDTQPHVCRIAGASGVVGGGRADDNWGGVRGDAEGSGRGAGGCGLGGRNEPSGCTGSCDDSDVCVSSESTTLHEGCERVCFFLAAELLEASDGTT